MWLLFQPADESARPRQSYVKIVDPEKQEEAVARLGTVGACQRRMLVGTPRVETEQDRSIRVEDLPEVVVGRSRFRQTKQRLVPLEALGHVGYANDRPYALHRFLSALPSTRAEISVSLRDVQLEARTHICCGFEGGTMARPVEYHPVLLQSPRTTMLGAALVGFSKM